MPKLRSDPAQIRSAANVWKRLNYSLLAELTAGPKYPAELAARLDASRSSVSNHLACLRGCGLVAATYEGRRVRYDLADPVIGEALVALSKLPLGPCPEDVRT